MKGSNGLPKILVVDDDDSFRSLLSAELARSFPGVASADSGAKALELCEASDFDVVLLDIRMPQRDGLEVLQDLKARAFGGEIVMLTGHGTIDTAIRSLKLGAYDYLTKPCKLEELESLVLKAYEKCILRKQNWTLRQVLDRQSEIYEFVGDSAPMRAVQEMVRRVAPTDATVLLLGETGVGKGLVAQSIHRASPRNAQPFVVVDCTSLQEELLQSELFGHDKGAFSGAVAHKPGLFEVAEGGTIFMDEIGDLSHGLQAQLLQALDSGTFRRVGGIRDIHANVRILAATNLDLEAMVKEGRFREDLFYRINVVSIVVPPLRERREDIPKLIDHFIRRATAFGKPRASMSAEAAGLLGTYSWPGNVRELRNVIERALLLAEGREIEAEDLPSNMRLDDGPPLSQINGALPSLKDLEKVYIQNLLRRFSGHRGRIAGALGISERSLYRKLSEYGLE